MDEQKKAVIDADFFRHITEYERGTNLFLQVMDDLDIEPVMHEFVAKVELKGNTYLQQLIDTGNISIISYKDYLKEENKSDYEQYFRLAFEQVNYYDFPAGRDIYQYEDRGESLGEIRSLYMARKMGYIYFMSDDADARMLVKNFFSSKRTITVKTLFDTLVMCKEKNTALKWKDINPTVSNIMRGKQDKMDYLKKLYSK